MSTPTGLGADPDTGRAVVPGVRVEVRDRDKERATERKGLRVGRVNRFRQHPDGRGLDRCTIVDVGPRIAIEHRADVFARA